ncbi:hypothetical protein J6590_036118 [Homalodisca vitripennis]|nr:hypothetical protein J6590_036118 [Homalodisca vitripennis]
MTATASSERWCHVLQSLLPERSRRSPAQRCQRFISYTARLTLSEVHIVHSPAHAFRGSYRTQPGSLCQRFVSYTARLTPSEVHIVHSPAHAVRGSYRTQSGSRCQRFISYTSILLK